MKNYLNIHLRIKSLLLLVLISSSIGHSKCLAQSSSDSLLTADPQKLARGIGHFERARSLLLAAVREFDAGYEFVRTDQVLETDLWRKTILTRAEELETVLSPNPREIKAGSRYQPDSRLIGARVKPEANLKENSEVKHESKGQAEAKTENKQKDHKDDLDLAASGS